MPPQIIYPRVDEILPYVREDFMVGVELAVERWRSAQLMEALTQARTELANAPVAAPPEPTAAPVDEKAPSLAAVRDDNEAPALDDSSLTAG